MQLKTVIANVRRLAREEGVPRRASSKYASLLSEAFDRAVHQQQNEIVLLRTSSGTLFRRVEIGGSALAVRPYLDPQTDLKIRVVMPEPVE